MNQRLKVRLAQDRIIELAGTMTRKEMASELGISRASVNRCLAKNGVKTGQPKAYSQEIKSLVIKAYEQYDKYEVQKMFPNVRVRSIIERNPTKAKIQFWSDKEIISILPLLTIYSITSIAPP